MPPRNAQQPSFSTAQKWRIGLQVFLLTLVVLVVVGLANYLSHDYFWRLYLSHRTRTQLAPRTLSILSALTNKVTVTVYYDKNDPLYSSVTDLLNQYKLANRKIQIQTVDYLREPGAAQKLKDQYRLVSATDKNLIIFECEGRTRTVDGNALADYAMEQAPGESQPHATPVSFKGEILFTAVLQAVTSPKQLKACFLTGDGEHDITKDDETSGYSKFAALLQQDYIKAEPLSLLGTNTIPLDCGALIVAGPRSRIPDPVLEKIDQYLSQGGRLLALFKYETYRTETGLERVLAKWGIAVGANFVTDPDNTASGRDVIVAPVSKHPVVNALQGSRIQMILPRTISKSKYIAQTADAPQVEELAFTGRRSFLNNETSATNSYSVMAAVEKGAIRGVVTERGSTRIVAVGDSIFLANRPLGALANEDFARYAVNWLLDRPQFLEGLAPRPVTEFRLAMTRRQMQTAQAILLGAMPAVVLLLGSIVWLRRRR